MRPDTAAHPRQSSAAQPAVVHMSLREVEPRSVASESPPHHDKEMKHPPSGGDHACSVMAQCGSDSGDWWDREPEDYRLRYLVGPYMTPPDFERLSWWDDQDPEGGDFMGFGKYATWTYQQVKDMDGAYCAWAMNECDKTSIPDFRRFVSWLNSATAAPAAVEAVATRPSGSSSASATTPATPAAATAPTPGSASAPTPGTRAAATAPTPGSASAPSQRAAPRQQIGNRPHDDRMCEGLVEHPERLRQEWWRTRSGVWWTRRGPDHGWYP